MMINDLIGTTGVVALDITPADAGKVTIIRAGANAQMFARANTPIVTGTKVLITDVLDTNTVTVQPL